MKKKPARAATKAGETVRVLLSRKRIQERIAAMAHQIRRDFGGEPLHLVGVLKGAVFFLADLVRCLSGEVSLDFIAVSSYGKKTESSGQVRLTKDLDSSIEGKNVLLVEDILDTGLTMQYLLRVIEQRRPKRLRVAVLLDKPDRRQAPVTADYVGFRIPNEFVVGYGLDYGERYRNLHDVSVLSFGGRAKPAE
ncbi:MAG TPA: hypoxanthine phosphoribosyltransferase [Methylomirabilota bacterium]|nr:hypoxanthine phosphoribosyltransferase [Methylomirabilota bacterium]